MWKLSIVDWYPLITFYDYKCQLIVVLYIIFFLLKYILFTARETRVILLNREIDSRLLVYAALLSNFIVFLGHVHTYPEIFFRKYFFEDAKIFASTRSVFKSFSAVHTYPIVPGNFLICSSAQFFCRRASWNEHAHDCDLGVISFAHS